VVLAGKACFALNPEGLQPESGEKTGFFLMLDPIPTTQTNLRAHEETNKREIFSSRSSQEMLASVHLSTLTQYTDSRGGSYALTGLKQMAGSDAFLAQDDDVKKCSLERFEVCQTRRYLERALEECGCLPWALTPVLGTKVTNYPSPPTPNSKGFPICAPNATSCYAALAMSSLGCRPSCTGLYADVRGSEDVADLRDPQLVALQEEYFRYKATFARNLLFDVNVRNGGKRSQFIT
jgi:hypothetical protein